MTNRWLPVGIALLCAAGAHAQIFSQVKKEPEFNDPRKMVNQERKLTLNDQQFNDYMWNFAEDTRPRDMKIRRNVMLSETDPYWSRYSVWSDQTVVRRSAEGGAGKYSYESASRPGPPDRWAASQLPEADYPGKQQDLAIMAAVYRNFFDYRARGFAKGSKVYFLGLGPHRTDAPESLLAALQNDPAIKQAGIKLKQMSRSLEITDDGIRDRDSGAYGPAFRVDDIGEVKDGEVHVIASFSERDGFWFTHDLTLRQDKDGWRVVKDEDYRIR